VSQTIAKPTPQLFLFKVSLDGVRPLIWRRIVVPCDIPLEMFHELLQIMMGWTNSHLHMFVAADGTSYRLVTDGDFVGLQDDEADEDGSTLDMLVSETVDRFQYIYDLGDNWIHTVKLERTLPFYTAPNAPICLGGANAVPPEDCGGVPGYRDLRKVLANPKHPEHADMRRWAGRFDPEAFDNDAINKRLSKFWKTGRLTPAILPDVRGT